MGRCPDPRKSCVSRSPVGFADCAAAIHVLVCASVRGSLGRDTVRDTVLAPVRGTSDRDTFRVPIRVVELWNILVSKFSHHDSYQTSYRR